MPPDVRNTPRQDRREFVRAFAEHLWIRPGTDRPTVKPPIVLLLTVGVAAGALLLGLALHFIRPQRGAATAGPPPTPTARQPYTAVAGWDCASDATHGFEAVGRTARWYTVADGGWNRGGCNGSFAAIPMSGQSTVDNTEQYAVWWFAPGAAYLRCELSVYSPRVLRLRDAAGTAVSYVLSSGRTGSLVASFTVDQPATAGRWQSVGTFPLGPEGLAVRLANRGVPPIADGRIAVAQFQARCTG